MRGHHGLDLQRQINPVRGDDPMRTSTTEPQAALLVEETDITHPMPHRPVRIGNLVRRRRCRVAEVVLADVRAPGDDLTDLTRRQRLDVIDACDRGFGDRKSTRLNSSYVSTSYAVFCLKKKKTFSTLS